MGSRRCLEGHSSVECVRRRPPVSYRRRAPSPCKPVSYQLSAMHAGTAVQVQRDELHSTATRRAKSAESISSRAAPPASPPLPCVRVHGCGHRPSQTRETDPATDAAPTLLCDRARGRRRAADKSVRWNLHVCTGMRKGVVDLGDRGSGSNLLTTVSETHRKFYY